jgi:hypothetical protein
MRECSKSEALPAECQMTSCGAVQMNTFVRATTVKQGNCALRDEVIPAWPSAKTSHYFFATATVDPR